MRVSRLLALAVAGCGGATSPPAPTPACGDGVVDVGEACDDGNRVGGDGCGPTCQPLEGAPEREPNDGLDEAEAVASGAVISGVLGVDDTDCFALTADEDCVALQARLTGHDGACRAVAGLGLSLRAPGGAVAAVAGVDDEGCPILDPARRPGARHLTAGPWTVCVEGLLGAAVDAYTLSLSVSPDATVEVDDAEDLDEDGLHDRCDPDRDGDAVLDVVDDCPALPNGPATQPRAPTPSGFFDTWLVIGPFTGTTSADQCLPTDEELLGDDAAAAPALGDRVGARPWVARLTPGARLRFTGDFDHVAPPREVYAATWVTSAVARTLTLSLGVDDGARVWWNGEEVLEVASCQGVQDDQFQVPVAVAAGANRLVVEVRDQGGGWGLSARLLDDGAPVTDLGLGLSPEPGWAPRQGDRDGDGVGDLCDDTP